VLLLQRADRPGFWQSVTGSQDPGETLAETARRELAEETGIVVGPDVLVDWKLQNLYEIYPHWRSRYAPGVTHNTEHVYALPLPAMRDVVLAPRETSGLAVVALARSRGSRVFVEQCRSDTPVAVACCSA